MERNLSAAIISRTGRSLSSLSKRSSKSEVAAGGGAAEGAGGGVVSALAYDLVRAGGAGAGARAGAAGCFVAEGFVFRAGQPLKLAGWGPLQFAHFAAVVMGLRQSSVRCPRAHLRHLGGRWHTAAVWLNF